MSWRGLSSVTKCQYQLPFGKKHPRIDCTCAGLLIKTSTKDACKCRKAQCVLRLDQVYIAQCPFAGLIGLFAMPP